MKKRLRIFASLIFLMLLTSVYAFDFDDPIYGLEGPTPSVITFNNNTASVNASEIWITNAGNLDDVNLTQMESSGGFLNILDSWVSSLFGGSGNPFDQSLNTTDDVTFDNISVGRINLSGISNNLFQIGIGSDIFLNYNSNLTDKQGHKTGALELGNVTNPIHSGYHTATGKVAPLNIVCQGHQTLDTCVYIEQRSTDVPGFIIKDTNRNTQFSLIGNALRASGSISGVGLILDASTSNRDISFHVNFNDEIMRMYGSNGGQVRGLALTSDDYRFYVGASDDSYWTYDGNNMVFNSRAVGTGDFEFRGGDVGIGTDSPEANLHIKEGESGATIQFNPQAVIESSGNTVLKILNPSSNTGFVAFGDESNDQSGFIAYNHTGDFMQFNTGGSKTATLDSVGLDLTRTSAQILFSGGVNSNLRTVDKLFIDVDSSSSGSHYLQFRGNSQSVNIMRLEDSGNVGIGTINPSQRLSVVGWLNQTEGNFTGNQIYGEMFAHNDTLFWVGDILIQNVWINISINSTDARAGQDLNGFIYDPSDSSLSVLIKGKYDCSYDMSTGNGGNNQEYQFALFVDGVMQDNTDSHRKIGASGDVGDLGDRGFIDLDVGEKLQLQAKNLDAAADLRLHAASVNCIRIGDIL